LNKLFLLLTSRDTVRTEMDFHPHSLGGSTVLRYYDDLNNYEKAHRPDMH